MPANEKFMFDTIFDELEPIEPEVAAEEEEEAPEEVEPEPEEEIIPTFSAEEVEAARQEGFSSGKDQGVSETLAGIEKNTADTLAVIAERVSGLINGQEIANREISDDASALSLAVARKIFPVLNEQGALNEVTSTIQTMLARLIDEPRIQVKVNPAISDEITQRLAAVIDTNGVGQNLTIVADEAVLMGDCSIEWSNGTAERNVAALMHEIDDIIAQNSTANIESLVINDEAEMAQNDVPVADEENDKEIASNQGENGEESTDSEAQFEQNINDTDIELEPIEEDETEDNTTANEVVQEPANEVIEQEAADSEQNGQEVEKIDNSDTELDEAVEDIVDETPEGQNDENND